MSRAWIDPKVDGIPPMEPETLEGLAKIVRILHSGGTSGVYGWVPSKLHELADYLDKSGEGKGE